MPPRIEVSAPCEHGISEATAAAGCDAGKARPAVYSPTTASSLDAVHDQPGQPVFAAGVSDEGAPVGVAGDVDVGGVGTGRR